MRATRSRLMAVGFVSGVAAGGILWARAQRSYRRALFSRSPFRRVAALSYLRGNPTVETARLLREYVSWERRPALRRRGERLLNRVQSTLA